MIGDRLRLLACVVGRLADCELDPTASGAAGDRHVRLQCCPQHAGVSVGEVNLVGHAVKSKGDGLVGWGSIGVVRNLDRDFLGHLHRPSLSIGSRDGPLNSSVPKFH